jgi:hypothetical protein
VHRLPRLANAGYYGTVGWKGPSGEVAYGLVTDEGLNGFPYELYGFAARPFVLATHVDRGVYVPFAPRAGYFRAGSRGV